MNFFFLLISLCSLSFSGPNDLLHRPRSFSFSGGKAVFVDFKTADYTITYDAPFKKASVSALIKLDAPEGGRIVFDSVTNPETISFDGKRVSSSLVTIPNEDTKVRVLDVDASTGAHELFITLPLKELVEFKDRGVRSAFWTSDLSDREFLERYVPSNFEFDQVKMTFTLIFKGISVKQEIYTNGTLSNETSEGAKISFPDHFTSSSIFFHTIPEGATKRVLFRLKSIDGREIPATVYSLKSLLGGEDLDRFKSNATEVFRELESDYGAWPHKALVIYAAGRGGMEYCGATMTDYASLGHEMFHSYFARGVMPANGNAGWVDEALASWRDDGYPSRFDLSGTSRMSAQSPYTRTTDTEAYEFGAKFMSYLDGRLKDKGGLKPFMRSLVDKKIFTPFFVEEFIKELGVFYGQSFEAEFKRYTYGTSSKLNPSLSHGHKMSLEELKKWL